MNGVDNAGGSLNECIICCNVGFTREEYGRHSLVKTSCHPVPHLFHLKCITRWLESECQKVKRLGERQCIECQQKALPLIRTNGMRLLEDESPYCETLMFNACRTGNMAELEIHLRQDGTLANRTYHSVTSGYPEHLLAVAIKGGHTDLVGFLISYGADVNAVEYDGESPLYIAARLYRNEDFKMLIGAGAHINNALSTSVRKGNAEVLEYLIKTKHEPSQPAINNALHKAAELGQTQCLTLLIKAWATNLKGALSIAAERGDTECLKTLIEAGANDLNGALYIAVTTVEKGQTPLHMCAAYGFSKGLEKLLETKGVDVHATDDHGETALHLAAYNGHVECLRQLIKKGAKVNATNKGGETALHIATKISQAEGRRQCAAMDIDFNKILAFGRTPEHYVIKKENSTECLNKLLEMKADINDKNNSGIMAPHYAASNGYTAIVKALLAADGINVNEKESNGCTALHLAVYQGHTEIVKVLLAAGIKVNEKEANGWTALHFAASRGRTEIVKALLAADGIKVNEKEANGRTALQLAAFNGRTETVRVLLAADGVRSMRGMLVAGRLSTLLLPKATKRSSGYYWPLTASRSMRGMLVAGRLSTLLLPKATKRSSGYYWPLTASRSMRRILMAGRLST